MGDFLNEIGANLLIASVVFVTVSAPTFGVFFNQFIDRLKGEYEHTSIYVAIGVAITLVLGALISWKSFLLYSVLFVLTGLPMIFGEYRRTEQKRKTAPRRKRLPYAANGILDDARMSTTEAHRLIGKALEAKSNEEIYKYIAGASHELTTITSKLAEVKQIQLEK